MKKALNYIYYHLYDLGLLLKNRQARESAILYISLISIIPIIPFIIGIMHRVFGKPNYFFVIITILAFSCFMLYLVRKNFENKKKLEAIRMQFIGETLLQRRIGYVVVITLLFVSFGLFLLFLPVIKIIR